MRTVFFGTPAISANILSYLLANGVNIVGVVTKPDRAQGRSSELIPTPVKLVAQAHHIPCYQPDVVSVPEFAPTLQDLDADLFVVVAYGEIIKQHLLDMPKKACINLHVSLLPKYRGAAPIQRAIINGEKETGITIIHMVKKMDAGDMIAQVSLPIGPNTTFGELEQWLCNLGAETLLKTVKEFEDGTPQRHVQDESLVTLAPKIELEDCQIDWKKPAETIHNLVRGVNPHPGAWCMIKIKDQIKRLKVITTRVSPENLAGDPGTILACSKEGVIVNCGTGTLILVQVQLEGKKAMTADEFCRGYANQRLQFI